MLLVPRKLAPRSLCWSGAVMVILAIPAVLFAAVVAGVFAMLIAPLNVLAPRHWPYRVPAGGSRAASVAEPGECAPDQTLA